jgi:hypothetical protein
MLPLILNSLLLDLSVVRIGMHGVVVIFEIVGLERAGRLRSRLVRLLILLRKRRNCEKQNCAGLRESLS